MSTPNAELYRMVLPEHECPFGVRAKKLLEQAGVDFKEHLLTTRDEVEAFKLKHRVATTPQYFVDGERIGGSEEVEAYLAKHVA